MLPVHESAEDPEPTIVDDDKVHDRFVEFVVTPRFTVPANPLSEETTIDEAPAAPTVVGTLVGDAERLKSWTWNPTVAEWDRLSLVPVTVAR
jgi:hypothetical protein